jgi:NADH-quinone oxidoreductase subunit H
MTFFSDPVNFISQWLQSWLTGLGLPAEAATALIFLIGAGLLATGAMLFVVFLIWAERKILGRIQDRLGPNRVGPFGLFQTFADMGKIFTKEHITPDGADRVPYNLGPVLSVGAVLMLWAVIPFGVTMFGVNLSVATLYIVAVGSLGEMAVVLAGWGSNNKFALLAAFRAVAQLISYEVPMVISLLLPVMFTGSMGMIDIVQSQKVWYIVLAPVSAYIFFVSSIAEVGRAPFDLVESESELVAGFNIEYSGLKFGMFYVADFLHAFTVSLLFATFFLGGYRGPGSDTYPILGFVYYLIKTFVVWFITLLMRGALPRFRIDQMMDLNWKFFTPLSLVTLAVSAIAYKLVPAGNTVLQVIAMLLVNALVMVGAELYSRQHAKHNPRPVVVTTPRPVAIYKRPSNSGPGAQP